MGVAAGLHVLAILPPKTDENALAAAALQHSVSVHPLGWHRAMPKPEQPGLILGYASQPESSIARGIHELAMAMKEI
jgi:GntR family transcriptional regulator/MocR family aminotransferase